jgi:hypothetical protein
MENIYFVQAGNSGPIKIGKIRYMDMAHRLKSLQTGNHQKLHIRLLITDGSYKEVELHQKFARFHIRGEWFEASEDILEFIRLNRHRAGKINKLKSGPWNPDELAHIKSSHPNKSISEIANDLNRPIASVNTKLYQLHLGEQNIVKVRYHKKSTKYSVTAHDNKVGAKSLGTYDTLEQAELAKQSYLSDPDSFTFPDRNSAHLNNMFISAKDTWLCYQDDSGAWQPINDLPYKERSKYFKNAKVCILNNDNAYQLVNN